jgi:hypothetical protein
MGSRPNFDCQQQEEIMASFGTLDWIDRTGGRMTALDRLRETAQAVQARAKRKLMPKRLTERRIEDILPPDSAIALEALSLCREASPLFLLNHCLRSYFWARLLDERDDKIDQEALFVATMLHDLGLAPNHRLGCYDNDECFTAVGAREAHAMAHRHNWEEPRAQKTANAISLHLNVVVDDCHGPEARLVRLGSGADTAGLGLSRLHSHQIEEVLRRYPRHGMKEGLVPILESEALERPHCRMAFLQKKFDFGRMVQAAPFAE